MSKYSLDNFKKNSALETEHSALKTEHTGILSKVKELETKLAEVDKTISTLAEEKSGLELLTEKLKTDHTAEIEALKKEYQAKLDSLNQSLEVTKGSVNTEVVAALKSVGIQEGTIKETAIESVLTLSEARTKLASLKGKEAQTFYKQNKPLFEQYISNPLAENK